MSQTLAYIRTSTQKQDIDNQKLEIYEYAQKENSKIDQVIQVQVSSRQGKVQRRIEEVLAKLQEGDTLIVTEISRLGRSTSEVIQLINTLVQRNISVIAIKQNLAIHKHDLSSKIIVTIFSLLAELERDLLSLRTKEALAAKKSQGIRLGKPPGMLQKSKFDQGVGRIKDLLGLSIRKASKLLGYPNHIGLTNYIKTRQILAEIKRND